MDHPKGRKGKGRYPFEMDYDPLKPYIETIDEKGEVVRKRPESKTYNMLEMKDEDLEHLFDEDELKLLRKERKRQKELAGRDLCKEECEKKDKEMETLTQRNQVLEDHARKLEQTMNDYKEQTDRRMTQLAELVKGLLEEAPKLKRTKTIVKE